MPKTLITSILIRGSDKLSGPINRARANFSKFEKSIEGTQAKLRGFSRSMKKVGRGMTVGLTAPIAAFGAFSLRAGVNFQKAMNRVEAKTGATAEEMKNLEGLARELGSTTQFTATQAGEGMAFLAQAGFEVNEILKATPGLLNLAAAGEVDLGRAADIASNIMGAFRIEVERTNEVADVLSKVTASSNTNLDQLAEAMSKVAPVAQKFGLDIQETASAVGLLGNIGVQGTEAGTALRRAFLNLAAPASTARKMIEGLGVDVADSAGNVRSFNDIMLDLGTALDKLPQRSRLTVLNELFGARGIVAAAELTDQATSGVLAKFTEEMRDSAGAAEKMRKTMMKGLPGAIVELASAFEGFQITLTKIVDSEAVKFLNFLAKTFRSLSDVHPVLLKIGIALAGILAVLGPLLLSLGFMATGIAKILPILVFFGAAVTSATAGLVALGAIGFAGVGFAIYKVLDQWESLLDFMRQTREAIFQDVLLPFKRLADFLLKFPLQALQTVLSAVGLGSSAIDSVLRSDVFGANKSTFGPNMRAPSAETQVQRSEQVSRVQIEVQDNGGNVRRVETDDRSGAIEEIMMGRSFSAL